MSVRRAALLAVLLAAMPTPGLSAPHPDPSASPSRDPAYSSYAEYYLQRYPKKTSSEPYRYYNMYDYYRTRYGATRSTEPPSSHFYAMFEPQRARMLQSAMRFWRGSPAASASPRADHGR